jgi:hypothetical protein
VAAPATPSGPKQEVVPTCPESCEGCTAIAESDAPSRHPRRLTSAEQASLDDLFRNYLLSADCLADPEHLDGRQLANARRNISGVKALVEGAFTRAGRKQAMMTFFMGHCGLMGRHHENYGASVIVVMEAGKVVLVTDRGPHDALELLAIDVDNDGIDELLATTFDYASGSTFAEASIWSLSAGMTQLAHFDFNRRFCRGDDPEYFESTLLTRRDPETGRLCFLQRRRNLQCPPDAVDP